MVIRILGEKIFSKFRKFKIKRIIKQNILRKRLKRETRVSKTVPNIEIAHHKENIV